MTQTELSAKSRMIRISPARREVIFHDRSQPTEYTIEENSQLTLFDISIGTHHQTSTVIVTLNGPGAGVELYGSFFGVAEESFQIYNEVIHSAPHTKSMMLTRGVLGGRAKAVYNGRIRIPRGVVGCDGAQAAHTILLSRGAHLDAVPHLDIGNNDVACRHSVSVSYIDEIKKFYCEARGLSATEAVKAIVEGHFSAVLEKMSNTAASGWDQAQGGEFRIQFEEAIRQKFLALDFR